MADTPPVESRAATNEIPLSHVLVEEYEAQFGPLDPARRDSILTNPPPAEGHTHESCARRAFFSFMHDLAAERIPKPESGPGPGGRSALCLSGGGIRSATFNLGVLQRISRIGSLKQFDFLSTVSGGGYIGSWLSAWLYNANHDIEKVETDLAVVQPESHPPKDPANPEPLPVRMLRRYSRFLSPRAGLLSTDTWTLVAIYLRNLLLTWSVFLPLLAVAILAPRLATSLLSLLHKHANPPVASPASADTSDWTRALIVFVIFILGSALGMALFTQTSLAVRLSEVSKDKLQPVRHSFYFLWWLLPFALGCVALAAVPAVPPISGESVREVWFGLAAGFLMLGLFAVRYFTQRTKNSNAGNRQDCPDTDKPKLPAISRLINWLDSPFTLFKLIAITVTVFGPCLFLLGWSVVRTGPLSAYFSGASGVTRPGESTPGALEFSFLQSDNTLVLIQHVSFGMYLAGLGILPAGPLFERISRRVLHFVAALCAGATAGFALWLARLALVSLKPSTPATHSVDLAHEIWIAQLATFGPPMAALCIALGGVIYVGFISRSIMAWDADREWWARAGALVLRFAVAWVIVFGVVLFGPPALVWAFNASKEAVVGLGGLTGLVTILLGASGATPGATDTTSKERAKPLTSFAVRLAAPTFILLFFAFLSFTLGRATLAITSDDRRWSIPDNAWFASLGSEFASVSHIAVSASILLIFIMFVAFAVPSLFVNLTKFSLHGMYRDRLIRAFLGASNAKPDRDPFTDFDDRDNVFMGKIRLGALRVRDLQTTEDRKFYPLILALCAAKPRFDSASTDKDKLLTYLRRWVLGEEPAVKPKENFGPGVLGFLRKLESWAFRRPEVKLPVSGVGVIARDVVERLNDLLWTRELNDEFLKDPQAPFTPRRLLPKSVLASRVWLETMLNAGLGEKEPKLLRAVKHPGSRLQRPFHLVNVALNIVAGSNNAWQDRKAASFTFSPYHSGASHLGYRDSRIYGGPRGTSLGTAMTLSGAAVSPNQGYHSSPPIAFLLALFNVRLGAWLGNPGPNGERSHKMNAPRFLNSFFPLKEALGMTKDTDEFIYLSDGGHFDNLGLYEMVQRRCHSIVVVDAGADPNSELFDLGNAIRKIRIDLGIPIDLDDFDLHAKRPEADASAPHPGTSCGLGTIRYDVVDGKSAVRGRLLYVKPCIYWKEPADVLNYARSSKDFPHETTNDQWFSEPQFESYRQLGWHIMKTISSGGDCASIRELIDRAQNYLTRYRSRGSFVGDDLPEMETGKPSR